MSYYGYLNIYILALLIHKNVLSGQNIMFWTQFTSLNKTVSMHSHAVHEFLVCYEGSIVVTTQTAEYTLEQGASLFIPSMVAHEIRGGESQNGLLVACIDKPMLSLMRTPSNRDYIDAMTRQVSKASPEASELEELMASLDDLRQLKRNRNKLNQSLEENYFLRMLLVHAQRQQCLKVFELDDKGRIEDLCEWLKLNYHAEINLDRLCLQFGMSRSQLTRKFKEYCGYSVMEYVSQLRFEAAARMLAMTSEDVSEVALASGVSNLSHFHRQFKKRFGMTPNTFRNMLA